MAAPYTQLSPVALPGKRYSFTAKAEAEPEGRIRQTLGGGSSKVIRRTFDHDADLLELLTITTMAIEDN